MDLNAVFGEEEEQRRRRSRGGGGAEEEKNEEGEEEEEVERRRRGRRRRMYHSLHLVHSIYFVFGKSCRNSICILFSMVLTAFFTLRSFLNGNMVICPRSKHIVKCDLISDQSKRYCMLGQ